MGVSLRCVRAKTTNSQFHIAVNTIQYDIMLCVAYTEVWIGIQCHVVQSKIDQNRTKSELMTIIITKTTDSLNIG